MCLLYSQVYAMKNRDVNGNINFYFDNVFILKITSKGITSSNPTQKKCLCIKRNLDFLGNNMFHANAKI